MRHWDKILPWGILLILVYLFAALIGQGILYRDSAQASFCKEQGFIGTHWEEGTAYCIGQENEGIILNAKKIYCKSYPQITFVELGTWQPITAKCYLIKGVD